LVRYGAPVDRVALAAKDGWEASSRQRAKAGEGVTGTGSRGRDEVVEIEGAEQSRARGGHTAATVDSDVTPTWGR